MPVIPKCRTGNLPSPERVIQKLSAVSYTVSGLCDSRLSLALASRHRPPLQLFSLSTVSAQERLSLISDANRSCGSK